MKTNDISRLYEKLTVEEQADLAFKAVSETDENTLKHIAHAVPIRSYRMSDPKFQERVDTLAHIGFLWVGQFWKLQAVLFRTMLLFKTAEGIKLKKREPLLNQIMHSHHILSAHHLLFDGLEQSGVNKKAMIKFCDDIDCAPDPDIKPADLPNFAQEYYENTLAFYVSLIKHEDADPQVYAYLQASG